MENNSKALGKMHHESESIQSDNQNDSEFVQLFYEDKAGKTNLLKVNAGLIVGIKYNGKIQDDGGKEAEVKIEYGATNSELIAIVTHLLHLLYAKNPNLAVIAVNDFGKDLQRDKENAKSRMDILKKG